MTSTAARALTIGAVLAAPAIAIAQPSSPAATPAFEDFESGLNGFFAPPPTGAPTASIVTESGNSFARSAVEVGVEDGSTSPATTILANTSPGNIFAGDYVAGGIVEFSFDVRHNAPLPLNISARLATQFNFPGVSVINPVPVLPGPNFTTIVLSLDPSNPLLIDEGGAGPEFTLAAIQNIQLFVGDVASPLPGPVTFDVDNIRTAIPAPGAAGLLGLAGLAAARRRR